MSGGISWKKIVKSISGGSLLISGTIILNLVMSGMDWNKISTYGLLHELNLRGCAALMFVLSLILMISEITCILMSLFQEND